MTDALDGAVPTIRRVGPGGRAHTGRIVLLMVEPALTGCGLGRSLLGSLLAGARGERVQRFFERFGFTGWGRRPGWQRVGAGSDRDEIVMGVRL